MLEFLTPDLSEFLTTFQQRHHIAMKQKVLADTIKDLAGAMVTEQVGSEMGRIAFQGHMYLDMDTLESRPRTAMDLCWETECNATYLPRMTDAAMQHITRKLLGTRPTKKRANALLAIGSVLGGGGIVTFAGPGKREMDAQIHAIYGDTSTGTAFRGVRQSEYSSQQPEPIEILDVPANTFSNHELFTWICRLGHLYWRPIEEKQDEEDAEKPKKTKRTKTDDQTY